EKRGLGGRNQQLALAALIWVVDKLRTEEEIPVFLSGGTDGEDGPTDAAGAFFDREIVNRARELMASEGPATLEEHRRRNDAWPLFKKLEGLFVTGGTGTNVCDLRVMISPFRQ
ncbi:MAG: MOFRL family protein, partial [Planctomycetia bacterium]|nr:MOFRL family protein [Planctomycetia bacterium]